MSKKCTPLWRETHFQVKSVKTWGFRATFWRSDVDHNNNNNNNNYYYYCYYYYYYYDDYYDYDYDYDYDYYNYYNYYNYNYATLHYTTQDYTTLHYPTLHYTRPITPLPCDCNYTTPQLQLHYATTTTTAAVQHTTSSSCGWGDHCNHCNHSNKHNSNHLSVNQWIRSAIRDSQQPTSPIGFLLWNFA